jgi:hypothetical protein
MPLLTNSFEGGTNTVTISAANSGGASGTAFDVVTIGTGATATFDTAHAAHGTLAGNITTTATSSQDFLSWTTAMGTQTQVWLRVYCYFTANPGVGLNLYRSLATAALSAGLQLTATGKLRSLDSAGATVQTMTNSVALNAWFRVEAMILTSATVGQVEVKLFNTPDSTTPTETITSSANLNTGANMNTYRFGNTVSAANMGPFWMDDLGLSTTGYIGPVVAGGSNLMSMGIG